MWEILINLLVMSVAVFIMAAILPGIRVKSFTTALVVAVVYGLLNFVLFKVLIFITFPLLILKLVTFGMFGVVLNALLLMLTDRLLRDFEIAGFGSALLGALGISVINLILHSAVSAIA